MLEKKKMKKNSKRISYCHETQDAVASELLEVDRSIKYVDRLKIARLKIARSINMYIDRFFSTETERMQKEN
jgi:hypothetical protein